MKIVYEGALFAGSGGGPRHFEGIASALRSLGLEVEAVLPKTGALQGLAGPVRRVPCPGGRVLRHATYELARTGQLLRRWMQREQMDAWISRHSLLGASLWLAHRVADVVVLEVNGAVREEVTANFGSTVLGAIADWMFRRQIAAADLIIAVSPGLRDYVLARNPRANCHVVPNGASPVAAAARRMAEEITPTDLVYSGALTPWYDLETVFAAVALLRADGTPVTVRVVGDGASADDIADGARRLGVEDLVEFVGWVPADEAQAYVIAAQVALLPMRADQVATGLRSPLKLYEYAACGTPVVATGGDGIDDSLVVDSVTFYGAGDVPGCANALRHALGLPARSHSDPATWSWESRAKRIVQLIESSRTAAA